MGDGKRHQHRHDGHEGSMAASDDIRDVTDASKDVADAEKKKHEHDGHDVHARVIKRDQEGEAIKIVIASGSNQGLRDGMEGYLVSSTGHRVPGSTFHIYEVGPGVCRALLTGIVHDEIIANPNVVVNPTSGGPAKGGPAKPH